MADSDLFLRSDVDKGEVSVDKDLRLRADTDKAAEEEEDATIIPLVVHHLNQMRSQ
jgi:hypothetical protein